VSGRLFSSTNLEEFAARVQRTLLDIGEDPSLALTQIHKATDKSLIERGHHDLVQTLKEVPRSAEQYTTGAKAAFLKWWRESPIYGLIHGKASRGEAVFVDQAEGDRRAAICVNCPHNVIPAGKGWLQNWTDGQMLKSVEGRTTASQDHLGVCEVCSCELRAAVWWQPDIIATTTRDAKFARRLPRRWKRRTRERDSSRRAIPWPHFPRALRRTSWRKRCCSRPSRGERQSDRRTPAPQRFHPIRSAEHPPRHQETSTVSARMTAVESGR
jgi:hypothetical protein